MKNIGTFCLPSTDTLALEIASLDEGLKIAMLHRQADKLMLSDATWSSNTLNGHRATVLPSQTQGRFHLRLFADHLLLFSLLSSSFSILNLADPSLRYQDPITFTHPSAILWASFINENLIYANLANGSTWIWALSYAPSLRCNLLLIAVLDTVQASPPTLIRDFFLWSPLFVSCTTNEAAGNFEIFLVRGEEKKNANSITISSWRITVSSHQADESTYSSQAYLAATNTIEFPQYFCDSIYGAISNYAFYQADSNMIFTLISFVDDRKLFLAQLQFKESQMPTSERSKIVPQLFLAWSDLLNSTNNALHADAQFKYFFTKGENQLFCALKTLVDGRNSLLVWDNGWIFLFEFGSNHLVGSFSESKFLWVIASDSIVVYDKTCYAFLSKINVLVSDSIQYIGLYHGEVLLLVDKDSSMFLMIEKDGSLLVQSHFDDDQFSCFSPPIPWQKYGAIVPFPRFGFRIGLFCDMDFMSAIVLTRDGVETQRYKINWPCSYDMKALPIKTIATSPLTAITLTSARLDFDVFWRFDILTLTYNGYVLPKSADDLLFYSNFDSLLLLNSPLHAENKVVSSARILLTHRAKIPSTFIVNFENEVPLSFSDHGAYASKSPLLQLKRIDCTDDTALEIEESWDICEIVGWHSMFSSFKEYYEAFLLPLSKMVKSFIPPIAIIATSSSHQRFHAESLLLADQNGSKYDTLFEEATHNFDSFHFENTNDDENDEYPDIENDIDTDHWSMYSKDEPFLDAAEENRILSNTLLKWISICRKIKSEISEIDESGKNFLAWACAVCLFKKFADTLSAMDYVAIGSRSDHVFKLLPVLIKLVGHKLNWASYLACKLPLLYYLNSPANTQAFGEEALMLGKHLLSIDQNDPSSPLVNLFFIAAKKPKLLSSLWRTCGATSSFSTKLCKIYDSFEPSNPDHNGHIAVRQVALKNAFACMSKHEHAFAATLFIIGGDHHAAAKAADRISPLLSILVAGALHTPYISSNTSLISLPLNTLVMEFFDQLDSGDVLSCIYKLPLLTKFIDLNSQTGVKELLSCWIGPFKPLIVEKVLFFITFRLQMSAKYHNGLHR